MSDTIRVENKGDWREITLNRPDRLNSFNDEMHGALRAALEDARDEGARAVLLTGAGRRCHPAATAPPAHRRESRRVTLAVRAACPHICR